MSTGYPGANDGIAPPDTSTDVGKARVLVGDTGFTEYEPPVTGRGDYGSFSDQDLLVALEVSGGSIPRALGYAYLALAGAAGVTAENVSDFDLKIDDTKRPTELRLIAQSWFDKADKEDAASQDAFFVAPLGGDCGDPIAEGMMPTWGRVAVGRWSC